MTPADIRSMAATIAEHQTLLSNRLDRLRADCPHATPTYVNRGSTGHYDPVDNAYWTNWDCPDCGKKWWTDQSRATHNLYPGATKKENTP
jgi:hypothetical protein